MDHHNIRHRDWFQEVERINNLAEALNFVDFHSFRCWNLGVENQTTTFLNKTFLNVKSIRLASLEFPNTNAVINSLNRNLYWRNQEDINLDFTLNSNNKFFDTQYEFHFNILIIITYIFVLSKFTAQLNQIYRNTYSRF